MDGLVVTLIAHLLPLTESNLGIQIIGWTALMPLIILFVVNPQLRLLVHNGYRN